MGDVARDARGARRPDLGREWAAGSGVTVIGLVVVADGRSAGGWAAVGRHGAAVSGGRWAVQPPPGPAGGPSSTVADGAWTAGSPLRDGSPTPTADRIRDVVPDAERAGARIWRG